MFTQHTRIALRSYIVIFAIVGSLVLTTWLSVLPGLQL